MMGKRIAIINTGIAVFSKFPKSCFPNQSSPFLRIMIGIKMLNTKLKNTFSFLGSIPFFISFINNH